MLGPTPLWTSGQSGNKAFYSTGDYNGMKVGQLNELSYTMVAPTPIDTLKGPYLNVYVQYGSNGRSILSLDASPAVLGDLDGQAYHNFSTAHYRFNETVGAMLGYVAGLTPDANGWYSFNDVKDLVIAPGVYLGMVAPTAGWPAGYGPGDGVSLGWGNRSASDYLNPVTIRDVNVSSVPVPATLFLLAPGLAGLAAIRRSFKK
jgi:hypothetical protein